jgi:hypothetical protein
MLLGAILGWGILSPIAKSRGWAPGPVSDWNEGSRGWIVWVSMGLIIGDSMVGLCWLILRLIRLSMLTEWLATRRRKYSSSSSMEEFTPLLPGNGGDEEQYRTRKPGNFEDDWPKTDLVTPIIALCSLLGILTLCFFTLYYLFQDMMQISAIILAIIVVLPASLVAIRSLGETDHASTQSISTSFHEHSFLLQPERTSI